MLTHLTSLFCPLQNPSPSLISSIPSVKCISRNFPLRSQQARSPRFIHVHAHSCMSSTHNRRHTHPLLLPLLFCFPQFLSSAIAPSHKKQKVLPRPSQTVLTTTDSALPACLPACLGFVCGELKNLDRRFIRLGVGRCAGTRIGDWSLCLGLVTSFR